MNNKANTKYPKISIETITPEIAAKYLENNYENNRKVKQVLVNKYATDMGNGNFVFNPAAMIVFSDKGTLIDGQHRLWACVQSETPFTTLVCNGVPEETYKVIDIGAPRSVGDQLGCAYRNEIATLAKYALATKEGTAGIKSIMSGHRDRGIRDNGKKMNYYVTKKENIDEANANVDYYTELVQKSVDIRNRVKKGGKSTYAYFLWLTEWLERDDYLDAFVTDFCDPMCRNETVFNLREYLIDRMHLKNMKTPPYIIVSAFLYAYDAYRKGKTIKKYAKHETVLVKYEKLINDKREKLKNAEDQIKNSAR